MARFRPRSWTLAAVGLVAAGGLAGCGDSDILKEEPTPPASNTEALIPPGSAEAAAQAAARDAAARDAAVISGEAIDEDAGKAPARPPRRLPDGVGEGGPVKDSAPPDS